MTSSMYDVVVIGAGPIGLACAFEAQRRGLRCVVLEKGCLCNSIYHYPVTMRFFSTPELLEIGNVPMITAGDKPTRAEALAYYRRVAERLGLSVRLYEAVCDVLGEDGNFEVVSVRGRYHAAKVIAAIGFFDRPRPLEAVGAELPKVSYYYREAHPYAGQDLLIAGSGNSAVEAALECYRHGARVTLAVRGEDFHDGIKYWLRPDIVNRITAGEIKAYFNTAVEEIREREVVLRHRREQSLSVIANDFVLALLGYMPDYDFLRRIGVGIGDDPYATPLVNETSWESSRRGLYLAGVVVGGLRTNRWFIENSRAHATAICDHIEQTRACAPAERGG